MNGFLEIRPSTKQSQYSLKKTRATKWFMLVLHYEVLRVHGTVV